MAKESPKIFSERDILLVCDAGGGTTVSFACKVKRHTSNYCFPQDLSAMRVTGTNGVSLSLEQLDVVFGEFLSLSV